MTTKIIAKCGLTADINKVRTQFKAGDEVKGLDAELQAELLDAGLLSEVVVKPAKEATKAVKKDKK